tara:strand:+ start:209 stop:610 length:402 start_codon:yes stop_codon:yes gene_type:complete
MSPSSSVVCSCERIAKSQYRQHVAPTSITVYPYSVGVIRQIIVAPLDGRTRPKGLTTQTFQRGAMMAQNSLTLNIPKPELANGESLIIRVLDDKVAKSNRIWIEVEDAKGEMVHSNTVDLELRFAAHRNQAAV